MSELVGVYECTDNACKPFVHNHVSRRLPIEGEYFPPAVNKAQAKAWRDKIWRIGIGTLLGTGEIVNTKWLNED